MKIAPKFQIERAASNDPSRYVLNSVYLDCRDPAQHVAVATDGRILAAVPVEDVQDSEPGALIPLDAFKKARKLAGKNGTSEIVSNGVVTFADKSTAPIPEHLKGANFPNWKQVVPSEQSRKGSISICLNPHLLADVVAALGGAAIDSITIEISPHQKPRETEIDWNCSPFRITSSQSPGAFAVQMPMRIA